MPSEEGQYSDVGRATLGHAAGDIVTDAVSEIPLSLDWKLKVREVGGSNLVGPLGVSRRITRWRAGD